MTGWNLFELVMTAMSLWCSQSCALATVKTMVKTTTTAAKQRNAARRTIKRLPFENIWDDQDWDEDADHEKAAEELANYNMNSGFDASPPPVEDYEEQYYVYESPPLHIIVCWSLVIFGGILAAIWCRRS